MPLQLLCRLDSTDPETTMDALTEDTEDQALAGLTRLQVWNGAEAPGEIWVLFDVNDRAKAQGWLDRAVADTHGRRAAVTAGSAHFLRTA
ncbi:hypothetical protein OB2597_09649 [Pseudooceanicola batsensis HTCC2597]|uniref:Uncharacterized protein n=1 Tax=Pseudooceanicola batsensis (strain ATCC BAA-863 / DSM 15984 / KCTC 12145 / HTCC2597) TaxID=252305 RepID=A3TV52_PSEBH|nr:hypothetical protein [Pseudooceanicola batsensis]EAQ04398.1 hypothetical protein OB2597_09649 [Pseudooceanicola batsensis HTCC2597]